MKQKRSLKEILNKLWKFIKSIPARLKTMIDRLISKFKKSNADKETLNKVSKDLYETKKKTDEICKNIAEKTSDLDDKVDECNESNINNVASEVNSFTKKAIDELKKTMDENEAKLNIAAKKLENTKKEVFSNINERHQAAADIIKDSLYNIKKNSESIENHKKDISAMLTSLKSDRENDFKEIDDALDNLLNDN